MFAPIVIALRQILGKKKLNQLRGKAIALHVKVINTFSQKIGLSSKQRQHLIHLARNNGGRLGLLVRGP